MLVASGAQVLLAIARRDPPHTNSAPSTEAATPIAASTGLPPAAADEPELLSEAAAAFVAEEEKAAAEAADLQAPLPFMASAGAWGNELSEEVSCCSCVLVVCLPNLDYIKYRSFDGYIF